VGEVSDRLRTDQRKDTCGYVVEHDAGSGREAFELPDGRRLEDVEEAKKQKREDGVGPVGGDGDERDELSGDLVDDDVPGIFATGLTGDDGGGRYADERRDQSCNGGPQGEVCRLEEMRGEEPEDKCGDGAVRAGAGLHQTCAEEGADSPRPVRALLWKGRHGDLLLVSHLVFFVASTVGHALIEAFQYLGV